MLIETSRGAAISHAQPPSHSNGPMFYAFFPPFHPYVYNKKSPAEGRGNVIMSLRYPRAFSNSVRRAGYSKKIPGQEKLLKINIFH